MNLKRVLETEFMDTRDEAVDYNSMDHSAVNTLFVDDLLQTGWRGGDAIDVGTGTALIPIELAQRLENCRIMAVDAAIHMLDLARYNVEAAGLVERIQLVQDDSKKLEFADGMFDCVMSNSIVHHIPEPMACIREMVRVCRGGGRIFVRDLMRPKTDEEVAQLVETYAGQENDHQRQMFDDSLRAALTLSEIRQLVGELGFASETVQATSDRHWTWSATHSD